MRISDWSSDVCSSDLLTATRHYHETDLTGPAAIVMGTESTGLTEKWLAGADMQIKIPMHGRIDSLNVSTSCAILVFDAVRQRSLPRTRSEERRVGKKWVGTCSSRWRRHH